MKQDLQKYYAKLKPVLGFVRRYFTFIVILLVIGMFGFLVWRIGVLANAEPSDSAVDDALKGVTRPQIDPNAISKLQELQSENVNIQSLFPTSRDNPFQE
jgi:hypothetical protein